MTNDFQGLLDAAHALDKRLESLTGAWNEVNHTLDRRLAILKAELETRQNVHANGQREVK